MDAHAIRTWFDLFDWSPANPMWPQQRKAIWAWRKYRKARRWARVLKFIPFVRMIAIGNALGYGNCRDESDIDLVIVTASHRMWLVRLFVVGLLRMFRQRPGEHARDAICPSFFLTIEAMDLASLQLPPISSSRANAVSRGISHDAPTDPYLLFWVTQLTVLYDEAGTYDAFWRANAQWVRRWLPEARPRAVHPRLALHRTWWHVSKEIREWILHGRLGHALDAWARRFQERRLTRDVRAIANQDTRVVVNDRMIKLHTNDRRAAYRNEWLTRLQTV